MATKKKAVAKKAKQGYTGKNKSGKSAKGKKMAKADQEQHQIDQCQKQIDKLQNELNDPDLDADERAEAEKSLADQQNKMARLKGQVSTSSGMSAGTSTASGAKGQPQHHQYKDPDLKDQHDDIAKFKQEDDANVNKQRPPDAAKSMGQQQQEGQKQQDEKKDTYVTATGGPITATGNP